MVSRVRVNKDSSVQKRVSWNYTGPAGPSTTYSPTQVFLEHDVMTDEVTPNFHSRIAAGEVINNPMTHTKYSDFGGGGFMMATYTDGSKRVSGDSGSVTAWRMANRVFDVSPEPTGLNAKVDTAPLKVQCLARIDKTPYAFYEDVAEIHKFIGGIMAPLRSCAELSNAFLMKRRRRKSVADAWLSLHYGFMPAIKSIINAHRAYELSVSVKKPTAPVRKRAVVTSSVHDGRDYICTETSGRRLRLHRKVSVSDDAAVGILYEVDNPLRSWPDFLGLRNKDIPRTLWAVTPYSWVVDRFVNISDVIGALVNMADPNVRILTGWERHNMQEYSSYQVLSENPVSGETSFSTNGDLYGHVSLYKTRSVWVPTVEDAISTGVRLPQDFQTAADITSLIIQRLVKEPRRNLI